MKKILLLLFFNVSFFVGYADQPRYLERYKITSKNNKYFAWIDFDSKDTAFNVWDKKWIIEIYSNDSILQWSQEIFLFGYNEGILSDDGNTFVYVEQWYYPDHNLVEITRKDKSPIRIEGKSFNIPKFFLKNTVSHQLWLSKYYLKGDLLIIYTLDGRKWLINISNGNKSIVGFEFNFLNTCIILGIITLIIGIIILNKKFKQK